MALQADDKRGDIRLQLSEAYLQQRDGLNALREATRAADQLPNDVKAQLRSGNFLLLARHFEDARARADKALAIDPKSVEAMTLKGNALAGLKDLDSAVAEFQEGLALDPKSEQLYANVGMLQYLSGKPGEAEATFKKAVEMAPRSAAAQVALAGFYWAARRFPEAERTLKEALGLDPTNVGANRALGTFYLTSGRAAEAEPYFKALAAALKTDEAQIGLADYYLSQQRTDDAKAILVPLSQRTDLYDPATLRLAAIEANKSNRTVAQEMVHKILVKSPKYTAARVFEIRLQVLANKPEEVLKLADALVKDEPNSTGGGGRLPRHRCRSGDPRSD